MTMFHQNRGSAACLIAFGVFAAGSAQAAQPPIGTPQDWSSRAVIYHQPQTPDELIESGRSHELVSLYRDPRYVAAVLRRVEAETQRSATNFAPRGGILPGRHDPGRDRGNTTPRPRNNGSLLRDWSAVMGGGTNGQGGTGMEGVYPAKYNFDIFAAPSCTNDFVVYPIDTAAATQSGIQETWVGAFSGKPGNGNTITIGLSGVRQVVLTASNNNNSGTNFNGNSNSNTTLAANLTAAVNRFSSQTGYTATSSGATVTITANGTGNATNLAINESLSNFAGDNNWGGVDGTGVSGQANVVAYNQLYQGSCSGVWNQNGAVKAPRVMWAYNTGDGFQTETSPVLSYIDGGKQVAYVQRSGTTLQLVLLKWRDGDGTPWNPVAPVDYGTDGNGYRACTGDCYIKFTLTATGANSATWSSPFVDYAKDTLWVGDNIGNLHAFSGVFKGIPTRVTAAGGIAVANGVKLSSPAVYNGNVYLGSQSGGAGVGGMMHRVNIATSMVYSSIKLANDNSIGLRAGPIIDGGTGSVFGFLFNDGTAGDGSTCDIAANNNNACRVIARFAAGFAGGSSPVERAYVGRGNNPNSTLFAGAFDDTYYKSADGTGAMYIVGGDVTDTFVPTLWKVPFTAGAFGTPVIGARVGPTGCTGGGCTTTAVYDWSPVTLIKNGSNEYLYFSMPKQGRNMASCSGACLYMFNLSDLNGSASGTGAAWGASNVPSAALAVPGGTGGIVVDNISATSGSSQVYFSHSDSTGNAIQASQSALD